MSSSSTILYNENGLPYIDFNNVKDPSAPEKINVYLNDVLIFYGFSPYKETDYRKYDVVSLDNGKFRYYVSAFHYGSSTFHGSDSEIKKNTTYNTKTLKITMFKNDTEHVIINNSVSFNDNHIEFGGCDIEVPDTCEFNITLYTRNININNSYELSAVALSRK